MNVNSFDQDPSDLGAVERKPGVEQREAKTRVVVVGPYLTDRAATYANGEKAMRSQEARLDEAEGLALAINVEVVGRVLVSLGKFAPPPISARARSRNWRP